MHDDAALPMTLAARGLAPLDWAVLAAYGVLLAGTGAYFACRAKRTTADYFLGGHAMPVWAVAISILATTQSAATFVGVPESAFKGDLTYLSTNIGGILAGILLATVVIPAYYRAGATTPYQLLERRFGPGAKLASSWAYMVGRVFASGARVYVGAIPVSMAIFGDASPTHLVFAIGAFMAFGVVYTIAGGISSVIWTDLMQVLVYLGAAVVACVLLVRAIPGGFGDVVAALDAGMPDGGSKLAVVRLGLDFTKPYLGFDPGAEFTLLTALTGWALITLASHGMDQDLVQRMLTCKDARRGGWSVISGILIGIPAVLLFAVLGLLLWVHECRPDLAGRVGAGDADGKDVLLRYILSGMPAGAAGLMIAGVLAAGPAGINASLNSMASTFVSDVYRPRRPGRDERHYVRVGRLATAGWGAAMGAFALACVPWQQSQRDQILPFVLGVMGFAYAGLLGVFGTALFTRRGCTRGAVAALAVGFVVVMALQPTVWAWMFRGTSWESFRLASPWRLVAGAAAAFATCYLWPLGRDAGKGAGA